MGHLLHVCRRLLLALLALAGPSAAVADPAPALDIYLRPARLVAVEGTRRLNLVCVGRGSPVVVQESGAGDTAASWRKVQVEVAARTRVCAYDRAGYGFSDPASHASDPRQAVADLAALLRRAGIRDPVVLVGHSVGGLYAELFAATHPAAVAGLLLVDPTGLDDFALSQEVMTEAERARFGDSHVKRMVGYQVCLDLARAGQLVASPPLACRPAPTGLPGIDAARRDQFARPAYWAAYQSEMTNFYPADYPGGSDSVTTRQVRARPLSLGDTPFVVLMTPGRVPPGERGERLRAGSLAAAVRLVAASSRGRVVKVASGHYVQLEQPQAVIHEIDEMVRATRSR